MESMGFLKGKKKICALTCYDYPMAKILNQANIDMLLVGDSLGMVVLGYENTHFVTLDDMICFTQAVMRGNKDALIVADMPIATCDTKESALRNCLKVVKETSVRAVKIEGKPEIVEEVVKTGINVLGHTGLKPQEENVFKVQGVNNESREKILKEALDIEKAGAFALILECVPESLGKEVTEKLKIPVIGIGAGRYTDGQILVLHDILGLSFDVNPRFVRKYADVRGVVEDAVNRFKSDVENGDYPDKKEVY